MQTRSGRFAIGVGLVALIGGIATVSVPSWADPRPAAARRMRGGGDWETNGRAAGRGVQRWDIDVTRGADDSIEGRVTLDGSPLAREGRLVGKIEGRRVSGSIADPAGNHVATFSGTITPSGGARGSYEDRTGEVGQWSWNGPLPR